MKLSGLAKLGQSGLIEDEPEEIVKFIEAHPPVPKAKEKDPRCGFIARDYPAPVAPAALLGGATQEPGIPPSRSQRPQTVFAIASQYREDVLRRSFAPQEFLPAAR
jgi:hypothetical protein